MPRLDQYLKAAHSHRASDIHLAACELPRMRVDGDLVPMADEPLEPKELQEIMFEILSDHERHKYLTNKNLDKSYAVKGIANFRINLFMTRKGIAAVLRAIPSKIPSCADLGLPPVIPSLLSFSKGLILVTGPTGSGKSTTLAAMIDHINQSSSGHILTVEDPVEFIHESKQCLINQREIGSSCLTFADALKYALREDPDVILVGELRDLETIALAMTAAETGHLVFGTLHTRGAGASIDRIIDSFPVNQQAMVRTMLSESLLAVVSQSLLKRADGAGRVGAFEIMIVNHAISNLIREGKSFQIPNIIQTAKKEGMTLMDQYILELVNNGTVTPDEAAAYLDNVELLGSRAPKAKPNSNSTSPGAPKVPPPAPNVTHGAPPKVVPQVPPRAPAMARPEELLSEDLTGGVSLTDLTEDKNDATMLYDTNTNVTAVEDSEPIIKPASGVPVSAAAPKHTGGGLAFKSLTDDPLPDREDLQEREPLKPINVSKPPTNPPSNPNIVPMGKKLPMPPPLAGKKKVS